jgi:hypothetical protein
MLEPLVQIFTGAMFLAESKNWDAFSNSISIMSCFSGFGPVFPRQKAQVFTILLCMALNRRILKKKTVAECNT